MGPLRRSIQTDSSLKRAQTLLHRTGRNDFCSGRIWGLRHNGVAWENRLLLDSTLLISTFGEDESGELYVADYATGAIFRITAP